jgi:hypothetical protein
MQTNNASLKHIFSICFSFTTSLFMLLCHFVYSNGWDIGWRSCYWFLLKRCASHYTDEGGCWCIDICGSELVCDMGFAQQSAERVFFVCYWVCTVPVLSLLLHGSFAAYYSPWKAKDTAVGVVADE